MRGKFILVGTVFALASLSQASVPSLQIVDSGFNPLRQVVRISTRIFDQQQNAFDFGIGTGTIFEIHESRPGYKWVCVLTADHVARDGAGARADLRVGLGNIPYGSQSPGDVVSFVALGGSKALSIGGVDHNPDIAVLGVEMSDQELLNVTASRLIDYTDTEFSSIGYGTTGPLSEWTLGRFGYVQDLNSYGTKRHFKDHPARDGVARLFTYNPDINYVQDWFESDLRLDLGAGAILPGDSGGPVYSYPGSLQQIPYPPGGNLDVYTDGQMGVNAYISNFDMFGNQIVMLPGSISGYVALNPTYRDWIETECALVPEPASLIVFGSLLVVALRRRRK